MANEHAGHRQRLKNRFLEQGLEGFEPHQALELLLFFALPQGDVNPLAHRLIAHFGTLQKVLEADVEDLMQVEGVGQHTATLLHMVLPLARISQQNQLKQNMTAINSGNAVAIVQNRIGYSNQEQILILFLDAAGQLIREELVAKGSSTAVELPINTVVNLAARVKPASLILAHNHPGGKAQPSAEDYQYTKNLVLAMTFQNITVHDHIIVNGVDAYSFYLQGDMERIDKAKQIALLQEDAEY